MLRRFRRKPLRYGILRRGVSRNLAAQNPPAGGVFFLFFFLSVVFPYSYNDFQTHFGQIPRFFRTTLTACSKSAQKPIKQPVKNVRAFSTGLTSLTV